MEPLPAPAQHPDDLRIVAATPDDVGVITRLTRAAYAKWVPLLGREPLPMKVDYAAALQFHRFDLLVDGRQVLGLTETVQQNRHLLIVNIAIQPESQGRGFGRRLMAHAEALASAAGLEGMRLYTNARFTENIRLYASLGYAVEREEAMNGGVAVHMVKELEATFRQ